MTEAQAFADGYVRVSCELVSEMPNSLLAGKKQGISPIRRLAAPGRQRKRARNQFLTGQFPTHPNREFFAALQGIESGDQASFRRDHGIPLSSAIWRSPLVTNPIIGAVGRVAPARVQRAHRRCVLARVASCRIRPPSHSLGKLQLTRPAAISALEGFHRRCCDACSQSYRGTSWSGPR
jgi:hypothetical protein